MALYGRCDLRAPRLLGGSEDFGYPDQLLQLTDSLLVAVDVLSPPFLKVLDRSTRAVVGTYGPRGEGPEEFQAPTSLFLDPDERGLLTVYDFSNQRLNFFDIGERAPWLSFRDELPFRIDFGLVGLQPVPGGYMGIGRFADFTLLEIDEGGGEGRRLVAAPPFDSTDVGGESRFARSLNDARMAGAGKRVAVAYRMTALLDLIDLEAGSFKRLVGPHPVETRFEVNEDGLFLDDANEMAYVDIAASPQYVFALFDGRTRAMRQNRDAGGPRILHVFDWDGQFIVELTLDRGATALAVSDDARILWTGVSEPYPQVAEWVLPDPSGDPPWACARP